MKVKCTQLYCKNNRNGFCISPTVELTDIWYVTEDGEDQLEDSCVKCRMFKYKN